MEILKERLDIIKLVQIIAEEQGFKQYVITDVKTNKKGEGFLGQFYMVSIQDATSNQQLHLAIKSAFIEDKVRTAIPIRKTFENEIYFYSEVYPRFKRFEKERGVCSTSDLAPKCLKVSEDQLSEMLALENLQVLDFEMHDKKKFLDDEHYSLIFRKYGRLHAYSFALRDQHPEEYTNLTQRCHNMYTEFFEGSFFRDYLINCVKLVEGYLTPGEDDEVIRNFQKYGAEGLSNFLEEMVKENCEYSAILHGDCWSNNMMFKYEKTQNGGKKLQDVRLIDWQMIKSGSPVCDLSYCLYSGASKSILDNLDHYLQIYHDSFSKFVRELGSDPDKLFPFQTLTNDWKKYAKFGMLMGIMVLKTKMANEEDIVDFTDFSASEDFQSDLQNLEFDEDNFKKITRDLLHHMVEIDAL